MVIGVDGEDYELVGGRWVRSVSAGPAEQLATPRTIELSGAVTGSAEFDGSADVEIVTTLAGG